MESAQNLISESSRISPVTYSAFLQHLSFFSDLLSSFLTIISTGIVIWVYFTQRENISSAFRLITNFSHQLTLGELRGKLHNLSYFPIGSDGSNQEVVINLLSEISGQLKGNPQLKQECSDLIKRLDQGIKDPSRLSESQKRVIGHELSEIIRNLNLETYRHVSVKGKK